MKLLIISHTEHYKSSDGQVKGWGPTVNEINHLAPHFESIIHLAMLHQTKIPASALPYNAANIRFEALPVLGGRTILSKLKLLWHIPKVIKIVKNALKDVDAFQLRTPTGIGVFLIPYLTLFSRKKGWYKYAGNWNQKNPPLGYRLQRFMLKQQRRKVTINGKWSNQPKHCITFENPCLTLEDIADGKAIRKKKNFNDLLTFCFVGRLEHEKGVGRIINAFKDLDEDLKERIDCIHLVGDGQEYNNFVNMVKGSGLNYKFHKFLSRKEVFSIYKASHIFLLPTTASEGFPKVIAEAVNFGCIPLVSNVSAISQYIHHKKNGYVFDDVSVESVVSALRTLLQLDDEAYHTFLNNGEFVNKFTYLYYSRRIISEILR